MTFFSNCKRQPIHIGGDVWLQQSNDGDDWMVIQDLDDDNFQVIDSFDSQADAIEEANNLRHHLLCAPYNEGEVIQ